MVPSNNDLIDAFLNVVTVLVKQRFEAVEREERERIEAFKRDLQQDLPVPPEMQIWQAERAVQERIRIALLNHWPTVYQEGESSRWMGKCSKQSCGYECHGYNSDVDAMTMLIDHMISKMDLQWT